jgi:hypothetical protein
MLIHSGRSVNQNRYYWGVVLKAIAQHTGHTTEELHRIFKEKFLPRVFDNAGQEVEKSAKSLTVQEFALYIEQVRAFAGRELQVVIPHEG